MILNIVTYAIFCVECWVLIMIEANRSWIDMDMRSEIQQNASTFSVHENLRIYNIDYSNFIAFNCCRRDFAFNRNISTAFSTCKVFIS